ncbi:MAG: hypothetical protein P0Y55_01895 [Candidatus Cohnella colombiensis]|uniref:Uncharacterized protein n=1 Tax=Candidatus Cohnella colombiensis TaxID=3121368 RepID=A0AA95EWP3_9BACL|nr:MAG: hypothetical protein P0Y55_01895 [Cohnella sp.]
MSYAFRLTPNEFQRFEDEDAQLEKCREWGLVSDKATKMKIFNYKGNGLNVPVEIVGYVDYLTAVISFDNGDQHCIHPSYLKEMQASSYGQKQSLQAENEDHADNLVVEDVETVADVAVATDKTAAAQPPFIASPPPSIAATEKPAKKTKSPKLQLPEDKVKMSATIKEFTTVPNHFADTDDEVIIYEDVKILEPETELDTAWSSHSATMKKLELAVGDKLTFDAKIIAKKLTKHPVPYKINNPSKIVKA